MASAGATRASPGSRVSAEIVSVPDTFLPVRGCLCSVIVPRSQPSGGQREWRPAGAHNAAPLIMRFGMHELIVPGLDLWARLSNPGMAA